MYKFALDKRSLHNSYITDKSIVQKNAEVSEAYLIAKAVRDQLSGTSYNSIVDVVGNDKITTSGYLSEVYTVEASDVLTEDLKIAESYAAASIDFSELGKEYQLYDLLGMGFDSTCMTCNQHYKVMFVYGGTDRKTTGGFGYSRYSSENGDATLLIDLQGMMERGLNDGAEFTKALVEIFDESSFDFHHTKYAADASGKLYVCDDRPEYAGKPYVVTSDFYTTSNAERYIDVCIDMNSVEDAKDELKMYYLYDISSKISGSTATIVEAADGKYVQDGNGTWELYDASKYMDASGNPIPNVNPPKRYNIKVTEAVLDWEQLYDEMMLEIAEKSELSINATDYVYKYCSMDENPNSAYVSTFRFQTEEDKEEGMWIQAGPNTYQGMFLQWEGFSAHYLGLSYLSMTDREEANVLLRRVDKATEKISGIRSAFGAYTNRLEMLFDMNENYQENLQAAESKIRDTNMANTFLTNAKTEILQQVAQSILSQVRQNAERVLDLLQ